MKTPSLQLRFEMDLLRLNGSLAKLANGPDEVVEINNFPQQRNLAFVDPCEVKKIIDQTCLQLQVAMDDRQVGTDCIGELRIPFDGPKNSKNWGERSTQLMAQDGQKLILSGARGFVFSVQLGFFLSSAC